MDFGTLAAVMFAAACAFSATVGATPASKFVGTTLAVGRLGEFSMNRHTEPADIWQSRQKTHGDSDLYVQSNVWSREAAPGGIHIPATA